MCASIALPKLLLLLSEPGRLCKVHLEFCISALIILTQAEQHLNKENILLFF